MTPQDQEFLHRPEEGSIGDCFRACVASMLDLDIAEVPHFVMLGMERGDKNREEDPGMEWWHAVQEWLNERRLEIWYLGNNEFSTVFTKYALFGHLMVTGKAERPNGVFQHVCVAELDGRVVHDPNPSRSGLISTDGYFLITKRGTWANLD